MKTRSLIAALSGFILMGSAHSTIATSTLSNVTILGNVYNATFWQDPDGTTTFDQVFGSAPSLGQTFNASNAQAAATELLAAVEALGFDTTPGGSTTADVFSLDYAVTVNSYFEYTGWRNVPGNSGFVGVYGPFNITRSQNLNASFVTFEAAGTSVPEPGSLALAGMALAGFVATRRRNQ